MSKVWMERSDMLWVVHVHGSGGWAGSLRVRTRDEARRIVKSIQKLGLDAFVLRAE